MFRNLENTSLFKKNDFFYDIKNKNLKKIEYVVISKNRFISDTSKFIKKYEFSYTVFSRIGESRETKKRENIGEENLTDELKKYIKINGEFIFVGDKVFLKNIVENKLTLEKKDLGDVIGIDFKNHKIKLYLADKIITNDDNGGNLIYGAWIDDFDTKDIECKAHYFPSLHFYYKKLDFLTYYSKKYKNRAIS